MTQICTVDDASRVAEVRRAAAALARHEGLDDTLTAKLALIVTELSTNLLKHAKGGEVCLAPLSERGAIGVEVLAIDRGNADHCRKQDDLDEKNPPVRSGDQIARPVQ